MAGSNGHVLSVRGLSKRWHRAAAPILNAVDVDACAGELVWLAGDNGAGKTTLLRVLAGLLDAETGEIRVDGLDPTRERAGYARRIGFLSAGNTGLHGRLTVRQHLSWAAAIGFVPRAERAGRIAAMVDAFALEPLLPWRADRISMGQRQRVRLALAFIAAPRLLLLDEPRTSLDEPGRALLTAALEDHLAAGGAALWCAPSGEEPPAEASRELVLTAGKVVRAAAEAMPA